MSRPPLPREVRPTLGPLAESVPLFFRIETMEIAGLLAAARFAFEVFWVRTPVLPRAGWSPLAVVEPVAIARGYLHAFLTVAAVLILVPVASGERGLRPRLASAHFGSLAFAAAMFVGVRTGAVVARRALEVHAGVPSELLGFGVFWFGLLPLGLLVWSAWFLGNAVRRRTGRAAARARLLLWPGLLIAIGLGALGIELGRWLENPFLVFPPWMSAPGYRAVMALSWALLNVFAVLWMLRVVENEAEADPAPNPIP